MSKEYTYEEVRKHESPDDLWVVLNGSVYDVTEFKKDHPGGAEMLDMVGGMDATETFVAVGHSDAAREIAKKFKIGEISMAEVEEERKKRMQKDADEDSSGAIQYFRIAVTIAIIGYFYASWNGYTLWDLFT